MKSRVRAVVLSMVGALALAVPALFVAAPAQASSPLAITSAIQQGTSWLAFSDAPTYANEPKVRPGAHNFRLTLTNNSPTAVSITSADIGIAGAPTTCATATIQPKHSGSCTVPVTIVAGSTSFSTKSFLSNSQVYQNAPHVVIGVSYDLETTMTLSTPSGSVSPGDPALSNLPLGYRPVVRLTITNNSTVNISSVTVPGFNTSGCASALKTVLANTMVLCVGVPAVVPAGTTPVSLDTGAVGNGVFAGDRPGLGVALSYSGVGGCSATLPAVTAGQRQTVSCTGFQPGTVVAAVQHSVPLTVGKYTVAPDGSLDFSYTVPLTTTGGSHVLSIAVGGSTVASTDPFSVTAVALPETGTDPTTPLDVAALLLLLGGAGLGARHLVTRRKRFRSS